MPSDALRVGDSAHLDRGDAGRVRELGLLLSGKETLAARTRPHLVFDSVGSSAADAAVVALVVARASEHGVGQRFELDA